MKTLHVESTYTYVSFFLNVLQFEPKNLKCILLADTAINFPSNGILQHVCYVQ